MNSMENIFFIYKLLSVRQLLPIFFNLHRCGHLNFLGVVLHGVFLVVLHGFEQSFGILFLLLLSLLLLAVLFLLVRLLLVLFVLILLVLIFLL